MTISPNRIEIVGNYLAIQWQNGSEAFIDAKTLRTHSPSAENKGDTDIFGNLSRLKLPLPKEKIRVSTIEKVGNYAVRLHFSDGHSTGIYDWKLLDKLSQNPDSQN